MYFHLVCSPEFFAVASERNQRASFSVDRSNSLFSRTISSDRTLHFPPMPFTHAPFTWAYHFV